MTQLIPFLVVLALIWFLLLRPQRRRQAAQAQMQARLSVGDEVVTVGGLIGVVRSLGDDEVSLEIAPGVEARVDRRAVARVFEPAGGGSEAESPS